MHIWINTPYGDQFTTDLVRAVQVYGSKGVALKDAEFRMLTFIHTPNHETAVQAREILMQVIKGNCTTEIDWSFLTTDTGSELPDAEAANSEPAHAAA